MSPSSVAGRDAQLPHWIDEATAPERPGYDSAVVRGNGVGALVFAARLARSASFAGRVVLAGPAVKQDRRLIGGLTLRSRALDYYSAAYGRSRRSLLFEPLEDRTLLSVTDGLIAYYPFNGNANDESGNGNHRETVRTFRLARNVAHWRMHPSRAHGTHDGNIFRVVVF